MKTDRIERPYTMAPVDIRPPRWRRRLFVGALLIIAILGAAVYFAPAFVSQRLPASLARYVPSPAKRAVPRGDGPTPVLVAVAKRADVPVYFDGVGSSRALNTVTVRAQVDGKLMKINFQEGQDVERNSVLAEIEPTLYQAQLDQAVAKKAQDEAQLANARLDLDRYGKLAQTNAASRQQYDTQKALVAQLEAQVKVDQGAIDNAKGILSYTKVIAPLAGRTGIRLVDAGNIVHAADTTGIVVITQVKPIAVIFTLPQQRLAQVNKNFMRALLRVEALADDNQTVVDVGALQVIDNQVDQTTGTVKLKAEFPNRDLQLWPGQFVNVKLLVDTLPQVVVVPSGSVQRGPNGTFVYVAGADDTVAVHPVTVAQQDDSLAVIQTGVAEGDKVVTSGFAQLTDGVKVAIGTQENLDRPAGSERRRGPPRGNVSAEAATPAPASAPAAGGASTVAGAPPGASDTTGTTPKGDTPKGEARPGNAPAAAAQGPRPAAGARDPEKPAAPGRRSEARGAATATP